MRWSSSYWSRDVPVELGCLLVILGWAGYLFSPVMRDTPEGLTVLCGQLYLQSFTSPPPVSWNSWCRCVCRKQLLLWENKKVSAGHACQILRFACFLSGQLCQNIHPIHPNVTRDSDLMCVPELWVLLFWEDQSSAQSYACHIYLEVWKFFEKFYISPLLFSPHSLLIVLLSNRI